MRILAPPGLVAAFVASSLWGGCASHDDGEESGDQAVTSTSFSACRVVSVKDGHALTANELSKLGDPVANLILKGKDCPLTLTQIQAKLVKTDPCAPAARPDGRPSDNAEDGLTSRFVTDRSQLLERPDTYRVVITRACQKREDNELLLNVFGIAAKSDPAGHVTSVQVPDDTIELIGENKTAPDANGVSSGVFNYYAREDNQWKFFGSSTDFLSQGYDCNDDGACIPKAASKQRCAACHVGGGLNMKELESPWVNWEGGPDTFGKHGAASGLTFGTPGVDEIVKKRPNIFGAQSDGVAMEATVTQGNKEWVVARVAFLKTLGLKEVLRPLFCTTDMNLASMSLKRIPDPPTGDPSSVVNSLLDDLLVDRIWNKTLDSGANITLGEYMTAIQANGQHIEDGQGGAPLIGSDGKPLLDTVQGLTIPVRSGQDNAYIEALQKQRIVDIDVVKDVLNVDLTRPIYSAARCNILNAITVEPMSPNDMNFQTVKRKLTEALARVASPTPAMVKLLSSLKDPTDAGKHDFEAGAFLSACDERSKSDRAGYLKDYLAYASHVRSAVKRAVNPVNGGITEFAETLPVDGLQETKAAFDPKTCKLQ